MPDVLYLVNSVSSTSIPVEIGHAVNHHTDSNVTIGALMENSNMDVDPDVQSMDIPIIFFGGSGNFDLKVYIRLFAHLKDKNYDVIHTHHNFSGSVSRIIGKLAGEKIVDTEHRDHRSLSLLQNLANAPTLPLADKIISNSNVTRDSFRRVERILLSKKQLEVVYNGVDMKKINYAVSNQNLPQEQPELRIVTVGRMVPVKNQAILLDSFRTILDEYPQAELLVIGEGPLRESLERQARELDIKSNTRFTGEITRGRVYDFLSVSDVFVMPSYSEGFCVAAVEAMAAGLPVVVSDIPIFHEVIGETGVYFDPTKPDDLANEILSLLENPTQWEKKALAAQERVKTEFSVERTAREYYNIYKEVAGKSEV